MQNYYLLRLPVCKLNTKSQGFSLIELMVTVSVLLILSTVAAPSFSHIYNQSKLDKSFDTLYHAAFLARESAASYGVDTTLCPTNDGVTCSTTWAERYMVFIDTNNNAVQDNNEQLLREFYMQLPEGEFSVHLSANAKRIRFKPLGLTNGVWGKVCFKDKAGQFYHKKLVFSLANFGLKPVSSSAQGC